jgi:hypothetical protein
MAGVVTSGDSFRPTCDDSVAHPAPSFTSSDDPLPPVNKTWVLVAGSHEPSKGMR